MIHILRIIRKKPEIGVIVMAGVSIALTICWGGLIIWCLYNDSCVSHWMDRLTA